MTNRTRFTQFMLAVLCFASFAVAQVKPPFGLPTTQPASAYLRGYADAQRASTQPAMSPATQPAPNPIDKTYAIGVGGFASLDQAISQAQKDKSQFPAFNFTAGQTFTGSWLLPKSFQAITITGGTQLAGCAIIKSDATGNGKSAIGWLSASNVQIRFINFVSAPSPSQPNPPQAIYFNSGNNTWIDSCVFDGFAIGVTSDGGNLTTISNCGFFNQNAPHLGKSQGVFLGSSTSWTLANNIFHHCGWTNADYASTPNANNLIQLNHGLYLNNDSGHSGDGVCTGNIFVDCASSGVNSRVGGIYSGNIFRSNGLAADLVVEGVAASVTNNVFFGPVVDAPPFYGACSIDGISQQLAISGNYFFTSAVTPMNPAIRVDWPVSMGALPAGMSAKLNGNCVATLRAPTYIVAGRTLGDTGTATMVVAKGQPLPSLETFYACTPAQLESVLRSRVGMNDAYAIQDWSARSWAAMTGN